MFVLVLCSILAYANAARNCNGNIDNLSPTGMFDTHVSGSNAAAQHDNPYLQNYKTCFDAAADTYCIQASVIAAIASRETRAGTLVSSSGGYGDGGRGYGLMQCDTSSGLACTSCGWNTCCHVNMMTNFLVGLIDDVQDKLGWTRDRSLQGGVAAYNFGVKNVQTWAGVDVGTTHGDYSNDVLARAQWLKAHGWN